MELLPMGHGGVGTGRPNLWSRLVYGTAPALFGADASVPMQGDEQRAALRNALMAAGTGMAVAAGGPRSWGEFAPSPIASILMGLNAGGQAYRGAQTQSQRRGLLATYSAPESTPQARRSALLGLLVNGGYQGEAANFLTALTRTEDNGTSALEAQRIQADIGATNALTEQRKAVIAAQAALLDPRKALIQAQTDRALRPPVPRSGGRGITPREREIARIQAAALSLYKTRVLGLPAYETYADAVAAAAGNAPQDIIDAVAASGVPDGTRSPAPAASVVAPRTEKRVITADQRDFLMANNQWNPALYEVR